jgi:hypothetical protein
MEGSYDKVWSEMKSERVPSEEFAIFSEVSLNRLSIRPTTISLQGEIARVTY